MEKLKESLRRRQNHPEENTRSVKWQHWQLPTAKTVLLQGHLLLLVELVEDLHLLPQGLTLVFQPSFGGLQRIAIVFQLLYLVCDG